jgi:hypothetical protein
MRIKIRWWLKMNQEAIGEGILLERYLMIYTGIMCRDNTITAYTDVHYRMFKLKSYSIDHFIFLAEA